MNIPLYFHLENLQGLKLVHAIIYYNVYVASSTVILNHDEFLSIFKYNFENLGERYRQIIRREFKVSILLSICTCKFLCTFDNYLRNIQLN